MLWGQHYQTRRKNKMYDHLKIAVVGDYMTDYYHEASEVKLCPSEDIVDIIEPMYPDCINKPGGAGNVVKNVKSLGAGVGRFFPAFQKDTHAKHYYEHKGKLLFRVSVHPQMPLDDIADNLEQLCQQIHEYDGIIVADYNKGALTPEGILDIMKVAKHLSIPVFVDPKFDNWDCYEGATIFKPNQAEWEKCQEHEPDCKYVVITMGQQGMIVNDYVTNGEFNITARKVEVSDVTGAGDTCITVMALEYLRTNDILRSCWLANLAGGLVVQKHRTASVSVEELKEAGGYED